MVLDLKVLGVPQTKQSARFRIVKSGSKSFISSYQKKEVKDNERNLKYDIKSQLPLGFTPLEGSLFAKVVFVFPIVSSMKKAQVNEIKEGKIVYKTTKPDLVDNLMKGLFDAMNGVVFNDDAQVGKVSSTKIYGEIPMTVVQIGTVEEDNNSDAIHLYNLVLNELNPK